MVDIEILERMNSQPSTQILLRKGSGSFASARKKSVPLAHVLFYSILLEGMEMLSNLMVCAPATFRSELAGDLWLWQLCTNPNRLNPTEASRFSHQN